jgi:hypothetical protein
MAVALGALLAVAGRAGGSSSGLQAEQSSATSRLAQMASCLLAGIESRLAGKPLRSGEKVGSYCRAPGPQARRAFAVELARHPRNDQPGGLTIAFAHCRLQHRVCRQAD